MSVKRLSKSLAIVIFVLIILLFTLNSNPNYGNVGRNEVQTSRRLLSLEDNRPTDGHKNVSTSPDQNCTTPSIENFPHISAYLRKSILMQIIYCFLIIYLFIGIALICDLYFVPSLEVICDKLNLESDVGGSTFMAAGSSAPELATSVIGVFVAKDDIGISSVVGSAVFNIAFVISICALFAGRVVQIHWWPITRDSFFYLISICVLFIAMIDEKVTLLESIIFLIIYGIYVLFMAFNKQIERKVLKKSESFFNQQSGESSSLVSYKNINGAEKINDSKSGSSSTLSDIESRNINYDLNNGINHNGNEKSNESIDLFEELSNKQKCWNIFVYPIKLSFKLTIPDCKAEPKQKWFFITFCVSCLWISIFSYPLVWMITIIGFNLTIPDTVMGLVFIAAGASIPDAIASLIVVREGLGDMALTNAIASNVFDILVCLGLPWFIKTAIVDPGSSVKVISRGLEYSTLSLLSTVVFFLVTTHLNGWKLDRKYGLILMIWYVAFMTMASLYELNVLGQLNPPMCSISF